MHLQSFLNRRGRIGLSIRLILSPIPCGMFLIQWVEAGFDWACACSGNAIAAEMNY